MAYLFLIIIILEGLLENLLAKEYNIQTPKPNGLLFTGVACFCALGFFLLNAHGKVAYDPALLPYSLCFAAAFGTASVTLVFAIKTGPLSLSSLMSSYSLLIPTFYGIFFLRDKPHITLYFGLAALLVSLFLINFKKNEKLHFEPMWLVYVLLCFVSNGLCSTIQKMQQMAFDGAYKNEFMIYALIPVSFVLLLFGFLRPGNKREMLKPCIKYGVLKGVGNGLMNYLVMLASALLPNSVLFPSISAGGIVLTFFCAVTLYKERLTGMQYLGYGLGVVSLVLLNL